ncbi:hypothetical protein ACHAXT_008183 [Thalassiosira profunda]
MASTNNSGSEGGTPNGSSHPDQPNEYEMGRISARTADSSGASAPQSAAASATEPATTIVDEAQECLAQSLLMFLYADLRLLSATGRINTKFETLCIDSDRVPRTSAAEMAQLAGNQLPRDIASVNDWCEGVSPAQIMAILIVELRQEVLAQRKRVKEQLELKRQAGWVPTLSGDEDDDDGDSDDSDDDAGVMNKITDRKGRKDFETDMHSLLRSYNGMLAADLKGIPEVKLQRAFNPLRRAMTPHGQSRSQRPWLRPGGLTQRLFSFDDIDGNDQAKNDSDDEGSKKSQNSLTKRMSLAAMFPGTLLRKSARAESPTQVAFDAETPPEGDAPFPSEATGTGLRRTATPTLLHRKQLSLIEEKESEDEREDRSELSDALAGEPVAQKATDEYSPTKSTPGKLTHSKLFEYIESWKGMKHSHSSEFDLQSMKSDPGPTPDSSWNPNLSTTISRSRPPLQRTPSTLTRQLKENLTTYVEQYREDHALHNKLIIPKDDYETFAGAEHATSNIMKMTSSLNFAMSSVPEDLASDSGRNMSEGELLDFMTKCIQSRNVGALDFMADFFRDNTISQTMVKSTAQVVWLQDWFPIKDCIYAISVDKKKKRVLVVFRGAITRADWSHGFDAAMKKGTNPVKDEYEGKKSYLKIHRGFYTYLFRVRKDTQTRKYDEIANKVLEYGNKMIGSSDFTVTVNGYSLGGGLGVLFGFYASTDERFTRNGPVKIFSYGMPYVASHSFADAFRHQERSRKVQHARFYNSNDIVAHMPFNGKITKRGSNFVHVGVDVKLYSVPGSISLWGSRYPYFRYNHRQSALAAYLRAIRLNSLLNMPFPWLIKDKHGLPELQKRIARATLVAEDTERADSQSSKKPFLRSTLDEAYEAMVHDTKDKAK